MRKLICIVAGLALVVGAVATPAAAKKGKKKPKPIAVTYYLHGTQPLGEFETPDGWLNDFYRPMDAEEPGSGQAKSVNVLNGGVTPNPECSGNGLLPVWVGALTGTVVGEMKLTLNTLSLPDSRLTAVIYPDPSGGCGDEASQAAAQAVIVPTAGEGTTEVIFEDVEFEVVGRFIVQLHINGGPSDPQAGQVRVFYDSADAASQLTFNCIPAAGSSCTTA
ncbi:MAG: hypothetical protein ABR505_10495 [Actinomycetota bacterium]